jgi:hypothetical protein
VKIFSILVTLLGSYTAFALPTERYIGFSPVIEREFQVSIDDCSKSYFFVGGESDKTWVCQVAYPVTGRLTSVKSLQNGTSFRIQLPNSSFAYLGRAFKSPDIVLTAMANGYQISFKQNEFTILGQAPDFSDFKTVRPFLEDAARQFPTSIVVVVQGDVQSGVCH